MTSVAKMAVLDAVDTANTTEIAWDSFQIPSRRDMLIQMNSEQMKLAETRLHALRVDILRKKESAAEDSSPVELDQSRVGRLSRMDAMQQQAMAQELDRRRDTQLKRIEGAFIRLEKGTYGDCARCKNAIDEKRMDIDPTAFFCIECAELAEKR